MTTTKRRVKSVAAIILGRLGGKARAKALSPERRSAIARMGGQARLARYRCETLLAGGPA
jgi:general stress protein YciG